MISAHQTKNKIVTPSKNIDLAISDNLDLRKYYVGIHGTRYTRDAIPVNYTENDYIDQYRDLEIFFKHYIAEPIGNPVISYPDMKTKYLIELTDLRHQPDHIRPMKYQLFQEYGTDPDNARMFFILMKRREIELISDGNKLIEVKVI